MKVDVKLALFNEKSKVKEILNIYLKTLSSFQHIEKDSNGQYHYEYFDSYWEESCLRFPYLLYVEKKIAGFSFVRITESCYQVAEFCILKEFKRKGLGEYFFSELLKTHPGCWKLSFSPKNKSAAMFWKKMCLKYGQSLKNSKNFEGELIWETITFETN